MPDIESLRKEYQELLTQLSSPELLSDWSANNASPARQPNGSLGGGRSDAGWERFQELSGRKIFLEKIFDKEDEITELEKKIAENQVIIGADEDPDLVSLAQSEIAQLKERQKNAKIELENMLEKGTDDIGAPENRALEKMSAIMEIRAGTGGQEAALFAEDLYRMYSKYSQLQGWKLKVLDSSSTEIGGLKEIIFELAGDVFEKMQYEGGVHRVQRIPETEKAGRVHTSTVTVAVLPKPKKAAIQIKPDDLKIDFYCSSGPGGQYVNKRHTAVRITHLPTGLVVTSQTERDQSQNKNNALSILEARLLERQIETENAKMTSKRKSQIGAAKRAEKIRTYNFPQDRLTDHRTKKSWHNLEKIMNGELDLIIDDLQKDLK